MRTVARRRVMGREGRLLLEGVEEDEAWCGCGKEVCTGPICGIGLETWAGMGASKVWLRATTL